MKPTLMDISYGPHERNVFDLYLAERKDPAPLLFLIHGGGFMHGDKSKVTEQVPVEDILNNGITVASTNYRLTDSAPFPAQMMDAARALQTIRSRADEWNIDRTRAAASGGSAGAGISQWIAYHDDLADPGSDDPVSRESTHLDCILIMQGQCTYDPRLLKKIIPGDAYNHTAMKRLFGVGDDFDWDNEDIPPEALRRIEECGPLSLLTENAPPIFAKYQKGQETIGNVHHPNLGWYLKDRCDELGVECRVVIDTDYEDGIVGYYRDYVDFLVRYLGM